MADFLPGDYYGYQGLLSKDEQGTLVAVRSFLADQASPIVDACWMRGELPHVLVPGLAALDIVGIQREGAPGPTASRLLIGFLALELARCDPSLNSFMGIQTGLAMGSIDVGGDAEQRERWLPAMARLEKIGAFGLTEPHGGSDVAGGLETTARRDGEEWILNGAKRWIGNGTFADLVIIWARVEESDTIHGFVVERGTPGIQTTKMEGKLSLRITQNADITLTECRGAAWASVGTAMAAYGLALAYACEREQFGRPIAGFQLVQDLLVKMLGNVTATLGIAVRLAQLQDGGTVSDAHSALAKAYCSTRMREVVGWAREVFGGNGVLIGHQRRAVLQRRRGPVLL